jgi:hypothetical protein
MTIGINAYLTFLLRGFVEAAPPSLLKTIKPETTQHINILIPSTALAALLQNLQFNKKPQVRLYTPSSVKRRRRNNTGKKWKLRGGISPAFSTVFNFAGFISRRRPQSRFVAEPTGFVLRRGHLHVGSPCCRYATAVSHTQQPPTNTPPASTTPPAHHKIHT